MLREAPFDEAEYLRANPDVAEYIAQGRVSSGAEHYAILGRAEGRSARTRRGKLRAGLDIPNLAGVEVGALDKPTVDRSEGDIRFVDYADRDTLQRIYRSDPAVDTDNIVETDAVWGDSTLIDALGGRPADYVLASHVIEHVPDVLTWLAEIESVLTEGGEVRLVVPDKRYTFDVLRNESRLPDVLDAWVQKARVPLARHHLDFMLLAREIDLKAAWRGELALDELKPMSTFEIAVSIARDVVENGTYHDAHCWVFSPRSFCDLMRDLGALDLLHLRCTEFVDTERNSWEFYVALAPCTDKHLVAASWQAARDTCSSDVPPKPATPVPPEAVVEVPPAAAIGLISRAVAAAARRRPRR